MDRKRETRERTTNRKTASGSRTISRNTDRSATSRSTDRSTTSRSTDRSATSRSTDRSTTSRSTDRSATSRSTDRSATSGRKTTGRGRNNRRGYDKRKILILAGIVALVVMIVCGIIYWRISSYVNQYEEDQIVAGIYLEEYHLSGMTETEAIELIDSLIAEKEVVAVTLVTTQPEETEEAVQLSEFGLTDSNGLEIVEEALSYGKEGGLISRYKELKALEKASVTYELKYEIESDLVNSYVDTHYASMITEAVNATFEYTNGELTVIDGTNGVQIDIEQTVGLIEGFMSEDWNGETAIFELPVVEVEPDVTGEALAESTDVLGTYSTYCANSGARYDNVGRGAELVNGTVLASGEELDFYTLVTPFTEENGYGNAGSYLDGEVVDSMGGGICQVSTTLYNAVLRAELNVTQRYAHSMLVSYVDPAMDAAIAGTYKNLTFVNDTDSPIYIYASLSGTTLTFTIYGNETRDENRTIEFKSVVTADNGYGDPEFEENADLELGTMNKVSSGYVGKVAELWKYVYEDGVLVEEIKINTSTYSSSSETYEVGTSSSNSEASSIVSAAITGQDEESINSAIATAKALIEEAEAAAEAEANANAETEEAE